MIRIVGPKLSSSVSHSGGGGFSGLALMVTPCCWSVCSSWSSAKDGRWVVKCVALVDPPGSWTGFLVTPVMASTVVVTLTTLSAVIWLVMELLVCVNYTGSVGDR